MSTHFHNLTIRNIERLTDSCVAVDLQIPESLRSKFAFIPGQYLTFKVMHKGEEVRRSYSICSTTDEDSICVAIKRVDAGKFSTLANESFKVGDTLEVMEPMGNFISKNKATEKNYLCIAAGSGITPIMSIMQQVLLHEPNSTITLLYGNQSRTSIIFKDKIEGLKNTYMDRISVHHIFSREVADTDLFNGRITKEKLAAFGKTLLNYDTISEVFICGPEQMILSAKDFFHENTKIDHGHIHFELFTSPDQPKVETKSWKEKLAKIDRKQLSQVTVHLDGVDFEMDLKYGGPSILDAALKKGADLPYACKGGVCATCKAKLVEGEVDMEVNYALEEDELAENYILTCQSHPRTPVVVVDFDIK